MDSRMIRCKLLVPLLATSGIFPAAMPGQQMFLYAPCSTGSGTAYISVYAINSTSGSLTSVQGSPFTAGQFLRGAAMDPTGRFLYAGNGFTVLGFAADPDSGALTPIAGSPFTSGGQVSFLTIDPTGRFVYVGSYNGSNISAFSIDHSNGTLTPVPGSPFATPYPPVLVTVELSGRFVYVAIPPSNVFSIYGSILTYSIDPVTGALAAVAGATSTFDSGTLFPAVAVHPSGNFLYVASDVQIFAYQIDPTSGILSPAPGSPYLTQVNPIAVAMHPTGRFLYIADYNSSVIAAFAINPASGMLTAVPGSPFDTGNQLKGDWPEFLAIDPSGSFLYATSAGSNFWGYGIDPSTGALTTLSGFPFLSSTLGPGFLVTLPTRPLVLDVAVSHSGNFTQGQNGVAYAITVTNAGPASTSGTVTVAEELPVGLALVSMSGNGWSCVPSTVICSQNGLLAAGASYPPVTVTVDVANDAPPSLANSVTAFDVGSATASASDPTTIVSYASVKACDVRQDGTMDIADVQQMVNEALGVVRPLSDLNNDGVANIVDAQIVLNALSGLGCAGS